MVAINQRTDSQTILCLIGVGRCWESKHQMIPLLASEEEEGGGEGGSAWVGEAFLTNIPTFEPPLGF